jgi:nicotinate-nucleotide pyrophosphorylase (carboxylating)
MPPRPTWLPLLDRALAEDVGRGDVTSTAVLPAELRIAAVVEARQELIACGLGLAEAAFTRLDPELEVEALHPEGRRASAGQPLLSVRGNARSLLAAERTALNLLGRLCGVATLTGQFVEVCRGTRARIVDTRKTLPGWRVLDKYAVATGGGVNHRFGLDDGILIKDNHIAAAGRVPQAVKAARAAAPTHLRIQVEVESLPDAERALEAGADMLLLDNRTPEELRAFVAALGERVPLEASGGIHLGNVRAVAETGVSRISIGALTHSAPAADVALEVAAGEVAR